MSVSASPLTANPFYLLDDEIRATPSTAQKAAATTPSAAPASEESKTPKSAPKSNNRSKDHAAKKTTSAPAGETTIDANAFESPLDPAAAVQKAVAKNKRRSERIHGDKVKDTEIRGDRKPRGAYSTKGNHDKKDGAGRFNTGKITETAEKVDHIATHTEEVTATEIVAGVEAVEAAEAVEQLAATTAPVSPTLAEEHVEEEKTMSFSEYKQMLAARANALAPANVRKAGEGVDDSLFKTTVEKKKEQATSTSSSKGAKLSSTVSAFTVPTDSIIEISYTSPSASSSQREYRDSRGPRGPKDGQREPREPREPRKSSTKTSTTSSAKPTAANVNVNDITSFPKLG